MLAVFRNENAPAAEVSYLAGAVAKVITQYFFAVLAQRRCLNIGKLREGGELQRKARNSQFAHNGILDLAYHVARLKVGMVDGFGDRNNRRGSDAKLFKNLEYRLISRQRSHPIF